MKKYRRPKAKLFIILSVIYLILFAIGLASAFANSEQIGSTMLFIGFGGLNSILFIAVAIAESCSYLQMDETKIILHRAVKEIRNNGKKRTVVQKLEIPFSDIKNISYRYYKGDGIISKDTTFYIFKLKNGDIFEETFYNYGNQQVVYVGDDYGLGGNDESVYKSDFNYITIDNYLDFPLTVEVLL